MSIDEVKNTLTQQKTYLNDKYFVKGIGVFGSVVKNQDMASSDIDLLVEFTKPVGFFHFSRLEDYLGDILKREVDLVTKDALKPAIKNNVLKDVIYV
jgi:predicted nucleotidyltransferase